jgi:uncharacterized protein YgiB involved in biofilm formation
MGESPGDDVADIRDYGLAVFVIVLVVVAFAVLAGALWHREPDTALVLATRQDCLRAFDAKQCRAIVDAALEIHARTAPRFLSRSTCELSFGSGACREMSDGIAGHIFLPEVAAILASREGDDDEGQLLPLYFGPKREKGNGLEGRRVYYRGLAAGVLSDVRFGGAEISRIVDLNGKPITASTVKKLRGS